jgi:NAD(P)-dependent dehydrogenase (short-subunit alcohol dehydrogenase family)
VDLSQKVVVVTGAGNGIGRSVAIRCAGVGAALVLAGRSVDNLDEVAAELRSAGSAALVVPTDVTDPEAVENLAAETIRTFGKADVLVNNSGIAGPTAVAWETPIAEWQQTLDVNLTGPWLCARAFIPRMMDGGSGSIVNIGSVTGKRPLLGRTPYAASKAGLIGITRTLAEEAGPHGIRVNLISPGPVEGPRIERVFQGQAEATGKSLDEVRHAFESISPMNRMVAEDEVADAVVFLASDGAAAITGIDLNVSAGFVMY